MSDKSSRLEALKLWVQIISSGAIPLVLGIVGYYIQSSISEAEVAKSYVQIAVQVLDQPAKEGATGLRQWAVNLLDEKSPVPLPPELKEQLVQRTVNLNAFGCASASGSAVLEGK